MTRSTAMLKGLSIVISALLYAASFPPYTETVPLPVFGACSMVVALALLIWAIRELSPGRALLAGFWHGFIAFGIGASWFWEIFSVMSLALFGILATFHALFAWAVARWFGQAAPVWQQVLGTAAVWTTLEFIRAEVFWLKFPWFTVGLAAGPSRLLPYIGVYGVGFLTVLLVAFGLVYRRRAAGALLLWVFFIALGIQREQDDSTQSVKVALVQEETMPLKTFLGRSAEAPSDTQLFIWPEYTYASDLSRNPRDYESVLSFLRERPGAHLVLGTQTWLEGDGWHNTALTLNADGPVGRHFKNHTVHLFDDGTPGTEAVAVDTPLGKIGTPVCFDCDFQDVVRKMVAGGAAFIVAPTMDAAPWTERQHEQHARLFQIRAAENGRWIAVAATSGVTQIIDPTGRVSQRLPVMERGMLLGKIGRRQELTFFTRIGWCFPWAVMILFVGLLGWRWRMVQKESKDSGASRV